VSLFPSAPAATVKPATTAATRQDAQQVQAQMQMHMQMQMPAHHQQVRPLPFQQHHLLGARPADVPERALTIVLDIDETLLHSSFVHLEPNANDKASGGGGGGGGGTNNASSNNNDTNNNNTSNHAAADEPPQPQFDFGFHIGDPCEGTGQPPMPLEMREVRVYKRPGLERFLERASKLGEVILWTASLPVYAYPLVEIFDARRRTRATLTRIHTTRTVKGFIKDLSKLGRPLSRTVLVDNSPVAFTLQPDNAVPITSFYGDPRDSALDALGDFLESIDPLEDVRPFLRTRFQMLSKLLRAGMLLGAGPPGHQQQQGQGQQQQQQQRQQQGQGQEQEQENTARTDGRRMSPRHKSAAAAAAAILDVATRTREGDE
jgi:Dullard-like phosphatase family protein